MAGYFARTFSSQERRVLFALVVTLCAAAWVSPAVADPGIVTFGAPDKQVTVGESINATGAIAGAYFDHFWGVKGGNLVRAQDGTLATFLPHGTKTPGLVRINDAGEVAGYFSQKRCCDVHSFVRNAGGVLSVFDMPGAHQTYATNINAKGEIVGYGVAGSALRGFLRNPKGKILIFDAPGQVHGTYALSVNAKKQVAGYYRDSASVSRAFLRAAAGTFTPFDAPDAGTQENQGTIAVAINDTGTIGGFYIDANGIQHGFVRAPDGTLTEFDAPGAGPSFSTYVSGINNTGAAVGVFYDAQFFPRSFIRAAAGTFTQFDLMTAGYESTRATAINDGGEVTGEACRKRRPSSCVAFLRVP